MQVGAVHTPPAACKHVTLPCPYPSLLHWGHLSLPVSLTEPQIVFLFLSVLAPTPVSRLTGTVLTSLFQCSCKRTMRPFIVCCLKLLPWRISEAHKRRLALTKLHAAIAGLNNDRHLAGCFAHSSSSVLTCFRSECVETYLRHIISPAENNLCEAHNHQVDSFFSLRSDHVTVGASNPTPLTAA